MNPVDMKFWLGYLSEWLGVIAVVMIAGTSPMIKKIRRIEFRFPRREATFSLILFALIFFFAFQFFSNPIFEFLRTFAAALQGGEIAQRMLLALFSLIPVILLMVVRGQPLKSAGWSKENTRAGLTLGVVLLILVVFLRGKFLPLLQGISNEKGSLLFVILVWVAAEETIFRGYIQLRLMSYLGDNWGWLATSLLYVLWQLPGNDLLTQFSTQWPLLVLALVQGLLLGWIMRKTHHVSAPILLRVASTWLLLL
ncbi:MAG TPA: CPBP family intramembrane metalloprotease [Anaerolineaceae bacterium]|nr:CPBP family intramembrane metalloprotease [Anaerolineaceae bacterium]